MNSHEQDFQFAKALKTLQENTDPQNLVSATKQWVSKQNTRNLGALAIAQVLTLNLPTVCRTTLTPRSQAQCNVTIAGDLIFKQTRQTLARHSSSSVSPARYLCDARVSALIVAHCTPAGSSTVRSKARAL
jgi:hypothetical protein